MGFRTCIWYYAVRIEVHGIYGWCKLRSETLQEGNDGDVECRVVQKPKQEHGIWKETVRRGS